MDPSVIARATDEFGRRLETVEPSQWAAATPCADWDIRTLVNHVVGELLWMPPLFEGKTIAEVGGRFDGDVLGDDPLRTWTETVDEARAAAARPGAQERTVHLSFGDFPGSDYLAQVTSDLVIHSWDLARAVGADDHITPALLEFADDFLSPQAEAWRSGGAFGPAVEVSAEANVQDRLLALTGRSPGWTS